MAMKSSSIPMPAPAWRGRLQAGRCRHRVTLQPKGRYVALEKSYGAPLITNDGVTVAKEVELKNPVENMGAQLVREVAVKTNDVAGDGTTTATLLADVIVSEGLKNVTAGADALGIRRGIEKATDAIVAAIKVDATPVSTMSRSPTGRIAMTPPSATRSPRPWTPGNDGAISVEESQTIFASTWTSSRAYAVRARLHLPATWPPPTWRRWKRC